MRRRSPSCLGAPPTRSPRSAPRSSATAWRSQRIETSHAFHSRMMEPALPAFVARAAGIALAAPRIPVISNATGLPLTAAQATDPSYWAEHIRQPVRFSAGALHALSLREPGVRRARPRQRARRPRAPSRRRARACSRCCRADGRRRRSRRTRAPRSAALWCAGATIDCERGRAATGAARRAAHLPVPARAPLARPERRAAARSAPDALRARLRRRAARPSAAARRAHALARASAERGARRGARANASPARRRASSRWSSATRYDARGRAPLSRSGPTRATTGRRCSPTCRRRRAAASLHLGVGHRRRRRRTTRAEAFEAAAARAASSRCARSRRRRTTAASCRGLDVIVVRRRPRCGSTASPARATPRRPRSSARRATSRPSCRTSRCASSTCRCSTSGAARLDRRRDRRRGERRAAPARSCACGLATRRARSSTRCRAARVAAAAARERRRADHRRHRRPRAPVRRRAATTCAARASSLTARVGAAARGHVGRAREARRSHRACRSPAVLALRARGAEVAIVNADVVDARRRRARDRRRRDARYGAPARRDPRRRRRCMPTSGRSRRRTRRRDACSRAKVLGAFHLDALTRDDDLDLFMPVSSQASQVPEPGQVDYAAANAVLDVIADNRARRGARLRRHDRLGAVAGRRHRGRPRAAGGRRRRRARDGRAAAALRDVEYDALDHPVLRARAREADGDARLPRRAAPRPLAGRRPSLDGRPLLVGTAHLQLVAHRVRRSRRRRRARSSCSRVAHQRPLFPDDARHRDRDPLRARRATASASRCARDRSARSGAWVEHSTRRGAPRRAPRRARCRAARARALRRASRTRRSAASACTAARAGTGRANRCRARRLVRGIASGCPTRSRPTSTSSTCIRRCSTPRSRARRSGAPVQLVPHTYDAVPRASRRSSREVLRAVDAARESARRRSPTSRSLEPDGRMLVRDRRLRHAPGSPLDAPQDAGAPRRRPGRRRAPRRVVVGELGDLESMRVAPLSRRAPGPGEVEIEVRADRRSTSATCSRRSARCRASRRA